MSVTVTGTKRHLDLNSSTLTTTGNTTIGGDVLVAEGKAIKLGTGGTFQLWHQSGTNGNSFIDEQTAGELYIRSNSTIRLAHYANNTASANFNPAGAVELYHNTAKKFQTEAAGASVTGNFYLTTGNHVHFDNGVSNNYYLRKTGTTLEFKTGGSYNFLSGDATFAGQLTVNKDWVSNEGSLSIVHSQNTLGGIGIVANSVYKGGLIQRDGTSGDFMELTTYTSQPLKLRTNNADAVTIDTSQNATFAETVTWGGGKGILHYGSDRAILRADTILEIQTNGTSSPTAAITLDTSQNATFTGAINLDSSHINIDGNGAVIFDNTNNNNAWYIRNGGSNSATLQFGLGTSPGSSIKHAFNGDGSVSLADDLTISGQLDGVTNMFLGEYLYHQGDGDTYLNFQNADEFRIVVGGSEKLHFNTSRARINQHLYVASDSSYDLGTDAARFRNVYADTLYGDGSNITGVTATDSTKVAKSGDTMTGNLTISKSVPTITLNNTAGGGLDPILQASGSNFTISTTSITPLTIALDTGATTFQNDIQAQGVYVGSTNTSYDFYNNGTSYLNGAVTIDDNLTSGKHVINTANDDILTLNQTSTDNKWNYINFNNQGTREWFIGQDGDGNFDLYNDNINAYAITVNLSNNSILLNDTVTVAQALTVTSGDVTLSAGNVIVGSQYGIRFNDANTRIYTNTDTPEDLIIEADQDLLLTPDGQVSITGDLTVSGALNITGDINSYNVTDLDVVDKTITVGKGQIAANSGSSGIVVDRSDSTNPSMLWNQTNGRFDFNVGVDVVGQITTTGAMTAKGALYVKDSDGSTALSHIQARSNGTEGFLTVSNGSNWGFIVRGPGNDPRIGAWYGGILKIEGFHSSDGATGSNAIDFAQFDFGNDKFLVNAATSVYAGNIGIGGATAPNRLLHIDNTSNATKASAYFYTNAQHTGTDAQAHVAIYSDHASSTGDVLHVRGDGTGNLLTLNKGGTDKLVVEDDGTATFAGSVTSTTLIPSSHIYLGATKNLYLDGGGNTYIKESSADTVQIVTGGTVTAEFAGTALTLRNTAFTGNITASADSTYNIGTSSTRFAAIYADDFHGAVAAGNISSGTLSTSRLDTNVARTDNTQTFTGNKSFEGNKFIKTNRRVSTSQKYPLGHYTPGETVFEIDPTWTDDELKEYFDHNNVSWASGDVAENAPGGYAIYIEGDVSVGGTYNSGFPYIPIDQDGIYYMEVWIKNDSTSSGHGHYMGSIDYESDFSSTDTGSGNPGSFGYWVMSNTNPGTSWVKKSGYIKGHHGTTTGFFETDATYWTPQALFNYTTPSSGTRACYISGWKVIRVDHVGDRTFQDNVFVNKKLGIGTSDPGGVGYSYAEDLVILAGNSASDGAGISIDSAARQYGVIAFSDDNGHNGEIYYDHSGQTFNFKTSGTNRVTFNTSGITLQGTGRIQGVDTVSSSTDAASKGYVDGLASNYAAASHNHDDRYYTETESDTRFLRGNADDTATGVITFDGGALGNTSGNTSDNAIFKGTQSNNAKLTIKDIRTANGTDWTNAGKRLQMRIDSTDMGYLQFNGTGNNYGISMGTGSSSTERFKITSGGAASFTGSLSSASLDVTNNITVGGTVDGVDIAARDSVLTSTTTTANAALPKAGGTITGNLTVQGINYGLYHGENAASNESGSSSNYYHDPYGGGRHLSMFLKNARADIIRYRAIDNFEYWNGSSWVTDNNQLANVKKLLDGRQDTSWYFGSTYYKFRFTIAPSTSWPTTAKVGTQTSWTGSTYPGHKMIVEEYDGTSWSTRVTAKFGGSSTTIETTDNNCDNWGWNFISTNQLHTGNGNNTGYQSGQNTRITIDFYGWSPSNSSYVTVPMQNIFITSNFSGTENTDYTNLLDYDRNITTAGAINLGHASDTTIARSAAGKVTIEGHEIYHEGHKPTYSELGTMAYSNLTGTPTITDTVDMGSGFIVANNGGTSQFTIVEDNALRFAGTGATTVAFNATTKKVTIDSTNTTYSSSDFNHDDLTGFVQAEHVDWSAENAGTIHSSNVPAESYTAHENISAATSVDESGNTFIQDLTVDSNGHVTAIGTASVAGFASSVHEHDDRYYTETEVDNFAVKLTGTQTIGGAKTFTDDVTIDGEDLIVNNTSGTPVITLHHAGTAAGSIQIESGFFSGTAPSLDYDLHIKGAAKIEGIGADDGTYTGIVTSDSGVLKYRTKAQILSDIGAGTSNLALGTTSTTALAGDTTTISSAQSTKLGHISVTQAVDLDQVESRADFGFTAYGWGDHADEGYLTSSSTQSKYLRSDTADTAVGTITFSDDTKAKFGTHGDLEIYHDASNSFIQDTGTGNLYIDATSQIIFRDYGSGENMAKFINDGAIQLYHNNSQKFATTSSGVSVTGSVSASSTIGNKGTNIGQQMEYGSSSVATLRCDADRWRVYFGGGGQSREAFSVKETGDVGIGDSTPSYRLDVNGTIRATGDVIAYSDERVKENIKTIDNSLEKVNKLRGVEFNKIGEDKKSIGVIAQEIEKILPEVVRTDNEGMKSVAYGNVVGILIEAVKELTKEVEELKKCNKCKNCNCND